MNLLGAIKYDPASAVSKATSSLLAMTAFDTTNLRLAITVPAHGIVRFRIRCAVTGATTVPAVLFGVMNGATVVGRAAPCQIGVASATTSIVALDSDFIVTGLTPGALNADAAYAVQVVVASTNIKYGGPNDTSGADAWGSFLFEAWDPRPIPTATPGAANGLVICGANAATTFATLTSTGAFTVNGVSSVSQTGDSFAVVKAGGAGDTAAIKAKTDLIPAAPASTTNITAGTITTVTNLTNAPTAGDLTATMKASVTAAVPTAAAVKDAVWNEPRSGHVAAGTFGEGVASVQGNVTGTVATVTNVTNAPANGDLTATMKASVTAAVPTAAAIKDAVLNEATSGHATAGTVGKAIADGALDSSGVTTLLGRIPGTVAAQTGDAYARLGAPAGASVSADVAAVKSDTAAVKAQTDKMAFTVANKIDANVLQQANIDFGALQKASLNAATPASVVGAVGSVTGITASDVGAIKAKTDNLPSDPADESLIITATDAIMSRIGANGSGLTVLATQLSVNAVQSTVNSLGSNVSFNAVIPWPMLIPTSGTSTNRFYAYTFNSSFVPTDPDSNTIDIEIHAPDGTVVNTGTMTRDDVGQYHYDYAVLSTDPERSLVVHFDYSMSSVAFEQARPTSTQKTTSDLAAIKAKTDALPSAPADETLVIAATDAIMGRLGAPAGASVSADVAAVKTDAGAIKAKTDNLPASPASTTNITAGTITTVTNLTNAPTAGDFTDTQKASLNASSPASVGSVSADVGITQAAADKAWNTASRSLTDKVGYSLAVAPPTAIENADALLKRDWSAISGEAARSVLNALRLLRNKWALTGTSLSVKKENDVTEAWATETVNDSSASPIVSSSPTT